MALILNIDTAFETASVAISRNGEVIAQKQSVTQKEHASFLQPAIKNLWDFSGIQLSEIDAVAVSNGPGSYTGLRVGLSSAKGICYALNKPLILVNTLYIIAFGLKKIINEDSQTFFCPMIDARRMEVFTALYNYDLQLVRDFESIIVDENFLQREKQNNKIIAGGNGSFKLNQIPVAGNIIKPFRMKFRSYLIFPLFHQFALSKRAFQTSRMQNRFILNPYI